MGSSSGMYPAIELGLRLSRVDAAHHPGLTAFGYAFRLPRPRYQPAPASTLNLRNSEPLPNPGGSIARRTRGGSGRVGAGSQRRRRVGACATAADDKGNTAPAAKTATMVAIVDDRPGDLKPVSSRCQPARRLARALCRRCRLVRLTVGNRRRKPIIRATRTPNRTHMRIGTTI